MTVHKPCELFTLCSHSCLAYSKLQVHPSFSRSFTVGGTHEKSQRCHRLLQRQFVGLFPCFTLFYMRGKSPWSWCTRGAMNLSVSGVHPWEGQYLQCRPETRRGFGEGNGMGFRRCGIFQLNLQGLCLLGSLGTAPLGSYFIYNLYVWSIGQEVRNLPRKCSTSRRRFCACLTVVENITHLSFCSSLFPPKENKT